MPPADPRDADTTLRENKEDDYFNLGTYRRPVTAKNATAQKWFDRGLIWCYGFNHEEAARCFEKAIAADAKCILAYWGLAYALGPNYNKPWEIYDPEELATTLELTDKAVRDAQAITAGSGSADPIEVALVDALRFRYPEDTTDKDWKGRNHRYAEAMSNVFDRFGDDLDVAALYVDSLMNLTPWKLWNIRTGEPAEGAHTLKCKRILDRAITHLPGGDVHPGLLHLYIHLMEMSGTPEAALTAADTLRTLTPDVGHLNHMPSHLDVLCGDYRRGVEANTLAILADERFMSRNGSLGFYTLYRAHDYHFRVYSAMFAGMSKVALKTAELLEATISEEVLRVKSPPMADWLESFIAMRAHVMIRFGMWEELINAEEPADQNLYCVTTAMFRYAKGVALAATGKIEAAEKQRESFLEAVKRVPRTRTLFNNDCQDLLAIGSAMLDGELAYRKGDYDNAFDHLRRAIDLDDSLPYDEPWGWMQPTRHAYGALLLEQGRVEEAAAVYSADLGYDNALPRAQRHPNNVWALHGFHECLLKLGRYAEARIVEPQLRQALAVADIPIKASCYCRVSCCSPTKPNNTSHTTPSISPVPRL